MLEPDYKIPEPPETSMDREDDPIKRLQDFVENKPIVEGVPFVLWDEVNLDSETKAHNAPQPDFADLLRRASNRDAKALMRLVIWTRSLCREIELLARRDTEFVKIVASTFSDWPVVFSLNGAGTNPRKTRIGSLLAALDIGGENAFIPSYEGKRNIPDKLWARYAVAALQCLRINQAIMPALLEETKTAKRKFHCPLLLLRTVHDCTAFDVGTSVIMITAWQRQCVNLPSKLTKDNTRQFMKPAAFAIREFWSQQPEHFNKVKVQAATLVRHHAAGEYVDRALSKIEQAMRGLGHK